MRLTLIGVGRLKAGPERELFERYFKRAADLARALGIAAVELREIDESRARRAEDRCAEEARAIRAAVAQRRLADAAGRARRGADQPPMGRRDRPRPRRRGRRLRAGVSAAPTGSTRLSRRKRARSSISAP